jgi:hypothetical protein
MERLEAQRGLVEGVGTLSRVCWRDERGEVVGLDIEDSHDQDQHAHRHLHDHEHVGEQ